MERAAAAGAIDHRMNEDEEEMTMLKDCAALIEEAKLQAAAEKREKSLDPEFLWKTLMTKTEKLKTSKIKTTGVRKVIKSTGDQSDNNKERSKSSMAADRLLEDKMYLLGLSKGITQRIGTNANDGVDHVYKDVKNTAEEALQFLRDREDFWDQLSLGANKTIIGKKCKPTKALESTRLIF